MKAIILQHEKTTPAGTTLQWLDKNQIPFEICWPSQDAELPQLSSFDLLFICGGSMNVDQEEKFPWLRSEKALIKKSIHEGKKVVGLCLGGQLIAEALGAKVGKHPHFEVGWHAVRLKDGKNLMAFEWHGYSFSLPENAELIATNSNCTYQGFSFGTRVLGYQFHPETTVEWANECAANKNLPTEGFVQTADEIRRDIHFQPELQNWYFSQLDALLKA